MLNTSSEFLYTPTDEITLHSGVCTLGVNYNIVSAELVNGNFEVVKRYPSNTSYLNGRMAPDNITKEIYSVVDGEIKLIKIVNGTHTPSYTVPEKIEFDND